MSVPDVVLLCTEMDFQAFHMHIIHVVSQFPPLVTSSKGVCAKTAKLALSGSFCSLTQSQSSFRGHPYKTSALKGEGG